MFFMIQCSDFTYILFYPLTNAHNTRCINSTGYHGITPPECEGRGCCWEETEVSVLAMRVVRDGARNFLRRFPVVVRS